jgi:hypothetical protein
MRTHFMPCGYSAVDLTGGPASAPADDDLEPSLQGRDYPAMGYRDPPWPVRAQAWVALFGGPIALTIVARANALRLNDPASARRIVRVGAAVTALSLLVGSGLVIAGVLGPTPARLVLRGVGLALYPQFARLQGPAARLYEVGQHGPLQPLWASGAVAVGWATLAEVAVGFAVALAWVVLP